MNTILISYDLGQPETSSDYEDLISEIKKFTKWCHPLDSFWFVKTNLSTSEVREKLKPFLDSNDELLCMNVTGDGWASYRFSEEATNWMKENL